MGRAQGGQVREGVGGQGAAGPSPCCGGAGKGLTARSNEQMNGSEGDALSWSFFFIIKKNVTEQYDSSYISCLLSFFKKLK